MANNVDHTHGDAGTKPSQSLNFQDGDYPDPEVFDWFWSQVPAAINDHASTIEAIDSNEDGVVDEAEDAQALGGNAPSHYATGSDLDSHKNASQDVHGLSGSDPVAGQSYVDNQISTHAGDSDAHHTKYTDNEAVTAVENASEVDVTGTLDLSDGLLVLPVGTDKYATQ